MANRNEMIKKGTKGQETTTVKSEEEKQGEKMKDTKKKDATAKGIAEKAAIVKLMEETMKKLTSLATDIVSVPRKKYTGWKFGSKLLVTIGPRNKSFMMWVYVYNNSGNRINIEPFEIKASTKDVGVVVTGLISQVKKNYGILKAVAEKAKKPAPKKDAKEAPKKEAKKTAK